MKRNEEMAAILRAAADGADPFRQAQAFQQQLPPEYQGQGTVGPNHSSADMREGILIARVLRSMAAAYQTAAQAEAHAEIVRLAQLPMGEAP